MDKKIKLISGGVYKTAMSQEPYRVLAFDDIEVYYDAYWSSLDKWTFASSLKRQGVYYRTIPEIFLKDAVLIREQPLTKDELATFRPDLPFRLCRNKHLTWTEEQYQTVEEFAEYIKLFDFTILNEIVLPVTSITLRPLGTKGSTIALKSSLVTSANDGGFTDIELLWLAHNIQSVNIKKDLQKGVGIFRSGHEKKVPSYYIGNYYDLANHIPKEE